MATATSNPLDYDYYAKAIEGHALPLAYIDMDRLDANAHSLCERAAHLPLRLATKSLRCVPILRHLLACDSRFRGLMAYSAAEAARLAESGFDDILVAYPSVEAADLRACIAPLKAGRRIVFTVDHPEQLRPIQDVAAAVGTRVAICVDLDMSTTFPLLHFGVLRSPLRKPEDMLPLLRALEDMPLLRLEGLMAYEGQISGVPDALPHQTLYNWLARFLKFLSTREAFPRRAAAVEYLRTREYPLAFVNGGGTGSLESTRRDPCVTEVGLGSGLYCPTLFDHFKGFRHEPAAGFALPVVREARPHVYACSGGGYVASGPIHQDKQPKPFLPDGISLFKTLGAGEVQTSIRSPRPLRIGQAVFFRHAKAGELFERFNEVHLIRGGRVCEVVKTYRGEGWCFF